MRLFRARFLVVFLIALFAVPFVAFADAASQAQLQAELDQINAQIAQNQTKLAAQQKQRTSLETEVEILDSQIAEAQLEIKQRDLTIQQLKAGIAQKQSGIASLDVKVAAGEASLAQIIRETNQMDETTLAERVLGGTIEDLFSEADDFDTIKKALGDAFTQMASTRDDLSARKAALQSQNDEQSQLLQLQVAQQNALKSTQQQKENLVTAAKGQEAVYQQIIASQQQTAAQIKSQLFALNNASHTTSFGDMYQYAQEASVATGVEPAFILAILTEESNLGQNVGNCTYLSAMSPKRDLPVYLQIMSQLGLDPNSEKVSCAQSYGSYGGAMGPAQFIPSTWQLYQARIAQASGQNPPNPWDPRTATFATAIYMSDLGADVQTADAERRAALRYLAGSHWQNPAYAFYGEAVMNYTAKYQQNIQVLNGS
ncbi:MAG TPA: lytic murein transglycosylase [Candidatus Paceibacterota bacterium]|nr:lytic murein transglycosylase [Candidatus Paceibacterota bacterium]